MIAHARHMTNMVARMLAVAALLAVACSAPARAMTAGPGWQLTAQTYPTNLVAPISAKQEVAPTPGGTTFTLGYEGAETKAIADNAPAATVRAALEALTTIGSGDVAVEAVAGGYLVTFEGLKGNMAVAELVGDEAAVSVKTGGAASGTIGIDVFNIGAAASHGTITVTDVLPAGLRAKEAGDLEFIGSFGEHFGTAPRIAHNYWECSGNGPGSPPGVEGASVITCTNNPVNLSEFDGGGGLPTGAGTANHPQPKIGIVVEAPQEASGLTNKVTIAGGGAPSTVSTQNPVTISSTPAPFGFAGWHVWFSNADGTLDTQAGSHPYEATFSFTLNTADRENGEVFLPGGEARNLDVRLPPGFVGNPLTAAQCTRVQFDAETCPDTTQIGIFQASTLSLPIVRRVFNLVPPPGLPAQFGFTIEGITVLLNSVVRTGGDYGITTQIDNIPQEATFESILTLWGVPEEESHDIWHAGKEGGCSRRELEEPAQVSGHDPCLPFAAPAKPFFTLPTACGAPQPFSVEILSGWQVPGAKAATQTVTRDANNEPIGFTECEDLAFGPLITTAPDTALADSPAGLSVEVKPPVGGLEEPGELGTSDIEDTTVTLPEGLVINPGQAAGLQACQPSQDGLTTAAEEAEGRENDGPPECPNASKVGTVKIKSPLIEGTAEKEFEGNVYVLQSNPPEIKLLLAASADGVNLKLVGVVHLDEATGRLTTTFQGTPELPFTVFKLSFSGGPQAALATPVRCGSYTTNADFTPWSSPFVADFLTSVGFTLSEGADGASCPSGGLPFSPTLTAGSTTDRAGGFTDFSMLLQRGDGQQRIEKLRFVVPAGLAGMISSVPLCGEPQAAQGTCPAISQVGHAVVASGPGPYPLVLPEPGEPELPIYLTGPYGGAPFGLSIVTPVIAGPFNLGTIVTRAKIEIDPKTAQVVVTTDPLPQIVKGVPTDLRQVNAVIDRPGFMFNPTNCEPSSFSGTAWGAPPPGVNEPGETAAIGSHFGVGSCKELAFKPSFTTSTQAKASKANGASLSFKISYPKGAMGSESWFNEAQFDIPKQLPARLSTLQQACLAATYETNRAACPKASVIGHAVVRTPVLPVPLEGPVYFVSYGAARFPDAVLDLTGDNVHIELHGETFISKSSVTSATFRNTPDVPFESIEVNVPTGRYSEFGANLPAKDHYDFCGQKLKMPTFFKAQNGLEIHQETPVAISGCPKPKKAKKADKKHTKAASHMKAK